MAKDLLTILKEVRGTGAPEAEYTDGIYHDLTLKTTEDDGVTSRLGAGIYGSIQTMYSVVGVLVDMSDELAVLGGMSNELHSLYTDKAALDSLYASIDNVDAIIPHLNEVDIVANNIAVVAGIGSSIGNVNAVAETVVPNIVEILQADDNAIIATTKAGEALTSADNASTSEANALASENKAEKWAEEDEDVEVETGKYSAKHWAEKSKDWVVGSTVDDTTPQVDKSYSGSKVEAELLERDSRLDINEAKLTTIEVGATADQTAEEIEALYEGLADTNKYTDAEKTKVVNMPANTDLILGTSTLTRYDKILGSMDIVDMEYLNGDLTAVRYTGDNNVNVFCRDVLAYTAGDLTTVKHYYNTADLVTESGLTTLVYDVNKNLIGSNYTEG